MNDPNLNEFEQINKIIKLFNEDSDVKTVKLDVPENMNILKDLFNWCKDIISTVDIENDRSKAIGLLYDLWYETENRINKLNNDNNLQKLEIKM